MRVCGSCATERREPCQAGNRAALSGSFCAPQVTCYPHDRATTACLFFVSNYYNKTYNGGEQMYQALYRKYRPTVFDDVVGQEHITTTLKNEVATGKTSHAYLFTGSRGTGKTTCSKILAKAVNCPHAKSNGNPCGECDICRGVDDRSIMDVV